MTSVGKLWQYPVKSMQGLEVEEISLGLSGVLGDRAYAFVDVETGDLATERLRGKKRGPAGPTGDIEHARFDVQI